MMEQILVYWRDIPSQVIIKRGCERGKLQLSDRFQQAIDRAAMRAGKGSSNAYLSEWKQVASPCEKTGNLQDIASLVAQRLETNYPDERLAELIKKHGLE